MAARRTPRIGDIWLATGNIPVPHDWIPAGTHLVVVARRQGEVGWESTVIWGDKSWQVSDYCTHWKPYRASR